MALDSRQKVHTKKRGDCSRVLCDLLCVFSLLIFLDSHGCPLEWLTCGVSPCGMQAIS